MIAEYTLKDIKASAVDRVERKQKRYTQGS